MNYSILMAVYYKDNPTFFDEAIQSMLNQTILTNDFVIVCDGPLTSELNKIIERHSKENTFFNILRLESNMGLGKALNKGIMQCKNSLIARMDSDDVSLSNRCEIQLHFFLKDESLAIVSSSIAEYDLELSKRIGIKNLPETNEKIKRYFSRRNPFNHPVVMYKKEAVIDAGSYQDFYLLEDYYLWIRMINKGYKGYNIKRILLYMRTGEGMIKRRGGLKYFKSNFMLQKYLLKMKNKNIFSFLFHVVVRFIVQVIMPNKIRIYFYRMYLRKK